MEENKNQQQQSNEDNSVAIVAYLTLIGWIIALIMHSSKKTNLGAYHLREMLGLMLTSIVLWIVNLVPYVGHLIYMLGSIVLFILWILGLINAINRQMKPLPIVGDNFQKWFASIIN